MHEASPPTPPPLPTAAPHRHPPLVAVFNISNPFGFGLFGLVSARVMKRHALRTCTRAFGVQGGRSNLLLIVIAPLTIWLYIHVIRVCYNLL